MDNMVGTDVEQCGDALDVETKEKIVAISADAISTFILEKIVLEAIEKFGEKDFVNWGNRENLGKFIAIYLQEQFAKD